MKSCARVFTAAAALAVLFAQSAAVAKTDKPKSGKKKKGAASQEENAPAINIPIPPGHTAEGVVFPVFDKGRLQMNLKMELAKRLDNEHLEAIALNIQTFDENGQPQMQIDMPRSVLDLNTKIVTSDVPVTIRRADFEVTGDTMIFNTDTRFGKMIGKVRMLIFNRDAVKTDKPEKPEKPDQTAQPQPAP